MRSLSRQIPAITRTTIVLLVAPALIALVGFRANATSPAEGARSQRVDAAIARAVAYFSVRDFTLEDPAIAMVLTLLADRFPGALTVPSRDTFQARLPVLARKQFQIGKFKFHNRDYPIDPPLEYAAWIYGSYRRQIDALTDLGIECARYPLPPDFIAALRNQLMSGGYAMTHVALQLANATENECLPKTPEMAAFQRDVSGYLRQAIDMESYSRDIRIEAITLLLHLGATSMVQATDIDWVLNLQRPDGGWLAFADAKASHDHTTALALWAFLEWREDRAQA